MFLMTNMGYWEARASNLIIPKLIISQSAKYLCVFVCVLLFTVLTAQSAVLLLLKRFIGMVKCDQGDKAWVRGSKKAE